MQTLAAIHLIKNMKTPFQRFRSDKKYLIALIPAVALIYCWIKHFTLLPFTKPESFYYIFSTIAQSYGAILGLTGAYTIFLINSIDSRIFSIGQILLKDIRAKNKDEILCQAKLDDYLENDIKISILKDNKNFQGDRAEFIGLKIYRKILVINGIYIAIVLSIIVAFSIVLLPYSESFISSHKECGMDLIVFIILLSIFSLIETIIFIKDVVKNATDI